MFWDHFRIKTQLFQDGMEPIWRINRIFIDTRNDPPKFALIFFFLFIRGKARALVSDLTREKLKTYISSNHSEFLKSLVSYAVAVFLVSPLEVFFNELIRRLRLAWSEKLTTALARKMVCLYSHYSFLC